jgi:hypothetical protein
MKILSSKDLVSISKTPVIKASGNFLASTDVLKQTAFPSNFSTRFQQCLSSFSFILSSIHQVCTHARLEEDQELRLSYTYSLPVYFCVELSNNFQNCVGKGQDVDSMIFSFLGRGVAATRLLRTSSVMGRQ